jgi:predicted murein hydrolase (TIGR00659 family)
MSGIFLSPLFGIVLCIFAFEAGVWINGKVKSPIANPLLIAIILVIAVLKILNIPYSQFNNGGKFISLFLAPATAALALSIFRNFITLKKNLIPILAGTAAGSLVSIASVLCMCRLFHLDSRLTASLLPKSVTTPIAIEISAQLGGLAPVTVAAVVVTGIFGAVTAPLLITLFRIKNPVAAGIAIGTASHAVGTSKALELGEVEGAMSGVAIGVAGLITVLFSLFL